MQNLCWTEQDVYIRYIIGWNISYAWVSRLINTSSVKPTIQGTIICASGIAKDYLKLGITTK